MKMKSTLLATDECVRVRSQCESGTKEGVAKRHAKASAFGTYLRRSTVCYIVTDRSWQMSNPV